MRRLLLLFMLVAGLPVPAITDDAPATAPARTVLALRHAEKLDAGQDPGLSPQGQDRAAALAAMLVDAGIRRVFSTDYRRTRETVEPLAGVLDLEVEAYDPRDLAALVTRLSGLEGVSVVVGHSNTTHELVSLLGGEPGPPIDDASEFDRLYVIQCATPGETSTVLLRYGAR